MGTNAIAFIRALGLKRVDVLGFSMGGLVAQEITLQAPELVRRLILVGTYQYPELFVEQVNQFLSWSLPKRNGSRGQLSFPALPPGEGVDG